MPPRFFFSSSVRCFLSLESFSLNRGEFGPRVAIGVKRVVCRFLALLIGLHPRLQRFLKASHLCRGCRTCASSHGPYSATVTADSFTEYSSSGSSGPLYCNFGSSFIQRWSHTRARASRPSSPDGPPLSRPRNCPHRAFVNLRRAFDDNEQYYPQ